MRTRSIAIAIVCLDLLIGAAYGARAQETRPALPIELPDGQSVLLELAATPAQRSLGLMFRPALADAEGMLFLFSSRDYHAIWMKNMLISIDILWLDEQKRIVHVEANVPPCQRSPCATYRPTAPAAYVIELAAGAAERHQLRPGVQLHFSIDTTPPYPLR